MGHEFKKQDPRNFGNELGIEKDLTEFGSPKQKSQPVNAKIFVDREPSVRELGEGEHAYSEVGGVTKLHTKIRGILKSVVLT